MNDETTKAGLSELSALLGATHSGMKISATGVLGRIRDGRYHDGLDYGCGVMLGHLQQMADRFYAGDAKAVDEFLQLYCLDDARPQQPNAEVERLAEGKPDSNSLLGREGGK